MFAAAMPFCVLAHLGADPVIVVVRRALFERPALRMLCLCRMAGTRGAQLRQICNDLKRICHHPFMLPEFEPDRPEPPVFQPVPGSAAAAEAAAADAEYLSALLGSSAKLQLLDTMLGQVREQGKQVMVMAHSPRVSLELGHACGPCSSVWRRLQNCSLSVIPLLV